MQDFYCLSKYILYYLVPISKFKVQLIIRAKKPSDMNLRLPNLECLLMLLYDVIFVGQVLSYMCLQNLKAEVDQSLEPGRDHRQMRGNCFRLQGTCGKISWISVHSFCDAELVYKGQLETIFMKSYFGTTYWKNNRVSAKDYMGTVSISTYCFLSA